jgi:4-amino-4-deoxy-L-arabinose transferase-like glycosyltransferase
VTQTDNSALDGHSVSPAARLAWILLILATLYLCYFHDLGAIGLVGPDEPRYAWIARDMVETGDWVTPRLYGKPWFEKPVLYYWGAALSFKLFGVSEASARFPSAVSALLATLAMAWLAWRVYGAETARWLLLLLPTTVGMIGFSHAAATDMPFAGMLTIAMVFAAGILGIVPPTGLSFHTPRVSLYTNTRPGGLVSLFFFGSFLGLAVLAKGPAAIVLSGGAVLLWAIFTKRWRDAFNCLHPVAIASFCLTALPWYILCARRNPGFLRVFIIEHNFKRYLTPEFQHIQPFWYFIPILLIAFAPWILALFWSALYGALRYLPTRRPSPTTILLLCWSAFCIVFFSISKSKLPGYILTAVPAIGLLLARSYVHLVPRDEKSFRWFHLAFGFLSVPAGLLLLSVGSNFLPSRTNRQVLTSVAWTLFLFALANLLLALRHKGSGHVLGLNSFCVVPVLILVYLFPQVSAPWLRYDASGKTIGRALTEKQIPLDQLYVARMRRGQQYSLNFYLHREIETWDKEHPKEGYLLLPSKGCGDFVSLPWVCSDNPAELRSSGWFVFHMQRTDSGSSWSGLGALGGSGSDGNRGGRQPR